MTQPIVALWTHPRSISTALKSCGIQKNMEKFDVTIKNSKHLKSYYDYHIGFYDNVYAHRIKASD
jgi:hypothetical protein